MASHVSGTGVGRAARWAALAVPALVAGILAALVIGRPLFDARRVFFAVDTAAQFDPWSAVLVESGVPRGELAPSNPGLSDQGLVFYPYYRWVSRSWRAGDPPLWNPLVYCGAPGIGNPQSGAVDPQVLALVGLEALGGENAFHWGLAFTAWLRIALAVLGAYLLARALGLAPPGAALAGAAFGLSGYLVGWLNTSLGHVPPFLPWILLALEGTRGSRPARAAGLAGLALSGAILGGHPETAFYVGAAGGLWSLAILAESRRAGAFALGGLALGTLGATVSLAPFAEYLASSGAKLARDVTLARPPVDFVALGLVLAVGALVALAGGRAPAGEVHVGGHGGARGGASGDAPLHEHGAPHAHEQSSWAGAAGPKLALGLGLVVAGTAVLLAWRGLDLQAAMLLAHDAWGAPGGARPFAGRGSYVEEASGWLPLAALALALAAAFSAGAGRGPLRRRGLVLVIGFAALLLCQRAPGVLDAYRWVPLVGLGATARLGAVSALFLALAAGEALEAAPRWARGAAAIALVLLAGLAFTEGAPPPAPAGLAAGPEVDEHVGFALLPPADLGQGAAFEGWLATDVPATRALLRVEAIGSSGVPVPASALAIECLFTSGPSAAAAAALAQRGSPDPGASHGESPGGAPGPPPGARWFRADHLQTARLADGWWRFTLEFHAADGTPLGARLVRVALMEREARPSIGSWIAIGACVLWLALSRPGSARWAWCGAALAALHGLFFACGQNPSVPAERVFPRTATEEIIAREQGDGRFFSDPEVLVPDTGLVRGLRALDGYDGLDPASYDAYREFALKPGAQRLLGWHASGVELDSPAFRLLGASVLVLRQPLEHPGWELVAGPGTTAPERAECWIYRARAPLPRAFIATRVVAPAELRQALAAGTWDPAALACIEEDWRPRSPSSRQRVTALEFDGNARVALEVELDGDGLLVLAEQHFPGWEATVDGEPAPIFQVDGMFRGVPLEQGRHAVEFRYAPASILAGAWISLAALAALAACSVLGGAEPGARRR